MKALLLISLLVQAVAAPQAGVVTGRVVAADGVPVARVRVSLMPVAEPGTPAGVIPGLSNLAETDSSGNFRMEDVVPGRYYVVAGFVERPTYYPGVVELSGATAVNVTSGATVSGINFTVGAISTGVRVRGRVAGLDAIAPSARTSLNVSLTGSNYVSAPVRPDGSFEFLRVPPGDYAARISSAIPNGGSDFTAVTVTDKDISDIEVVVYRLKPIVGKVVIEGSGAMPRIPMTLSTGVRPRDVHTFFGIEPEPDGTFSIALPEGERRVDPLGGLPPGYVVKSFTYGNTDITRNPLKVDEKDSAELRLILATSNQPPVKVSGRINGLDRGSSPVRVVLSSTAYMKPITTIASVDGTFKFAEVFPGGYTVTLQGFDVRSPLRAFLVSTKDIDDLVVELPQKNEIRGRLTVEGSGPTPRLALQWSSAPVTPRDPVWINPEADGTFRVALYEGEYFGMRLNVPKGYLVKSLTYGSTDIRRTPQLTVTASDTAQFDVKVASSDLSPVKVSGHATGLDPLSLASGDVKVLLKTSAYNAALSAEVARDGSFEFPAVFPGNYALVLTGSGVPTNTCAPLVVAGTDRTVNIAAPQSGTRAEDIAIISAIYGANAGSADVTPLVTKWMKPGMDELYTAPKWLEVDPATGQLKDLVISYLYQCEEHLLTTVEPGAVSYSILAEHANPSLRKDPAPSGNSGLTILSAYYGSGNQYRVVTPKVRELLGPGKPFVVDDAILNVNVTTGSRVLITTYSYQGERRTAVVWRNGEISLPRLASIASEMPWQQRRSSDQPEWMNDAEPFAPREPGDPGPGAGQSPRRELAIASLIRALAELKAISPAESNREILTITSITQQALADAQANITYVYPPPASKPIVAPVSAGSKSVRLAKASKALKAAQEQLSNAGSGPNELFLGLAMEEIQQALAALQKAAEAR